MAISPIVCQAGAISGRLDGREAGFACAAIVPPSFTLLIFGVLLTILSRMTMDRGQRRARIKVPALAGASFSRRDSRAGGTHLGDPLVELARQMRHDAELPLDQHQLRAMVHLVLLRAK